MVWRRQQEKIKHQIYGIVGMYWNKWLWQLKSAQTFFQSFKEVSARDKAEERRNHQHIWQMLKLEQADSLQQMWWWTEQYVLYDPERRVVRHLSEINSNALQMTLTFELCEKSKGNPMHPQYCTHGMSKSTLIWQDSKFYSVETIFL